jgi:hypothetical protein
VAKFQNSGETMKAKYLGILGIVLIAAGILTVIRGVQSIRYYNGELADLGAGPGAILIGLMCVTLARHPRSPFRRPPNAGRPK